MYENMQLHTAKLHLQTFSHNRFMTSFENCLSVHINIFIHMKLEKLLNILLNNVPFKKHFSVRYRILKDPICKDVFARTIFMLFSSALPEII